MPKRGAREDFQIEVTAPGVTRRAFPLAITYTALGIWGENPRKAASVLAEALVESHGTAQSFPEGGFWFDSYSSSETLPQTADLVRDRGWRAFLTQVDRISLGAELLDVLSELDVISLGLRDRPFLRPLDILFEPSRALEDLETEAKDHPHLIYRICILSGIIDRFDFVESGRSLNGLRDWLTEVVGADKASGFTETYRNVKRLRRQYPIHEGYDTAGGERQRRGEIVAAERYFDFQGVPGADWNRLLARFIEDTQHIRDVLAVL